MYKPEDPIQQLADYIKKNINKGYTLDSLKFSLINQGYSKITVENAIEKFNKQLATEIPLIKEKPQISHRIILSKENRSEIINIPPEKKGWLRRLFD